MAAKEGRPSILAVDDESAIREMLAAILERDGFDVTTAANVTDALALINTQPFDILLSDLNIGEAGDGFTVASAMRRRWPHAITLILTGYPDFEAALEAIREQVDDYLVKPLDPTRLLQVLRDKLQALPSVRRAPPTKRVADVIRENRDSIIADWLKRTKLHPDLIVIALSDDERKDHLPPRLDELVLTLEADLGKTSAEQLRAAFEHGKTRRHQQYSVDMLVEEARILEHCIFGTVQNNLLTIDISRIIPDLVQITDISQIQLRETLRGFTAAEESIPQSQSRKPVTSAHQSVREHHIDEA